MAIVTLAATAIVTCGCGSGSSKPLTRAELTAKANAICRQLNTQMNAASSKSNSKDPAQVFLQAAAFERARLAEMEKLNPPANLVDDWKQIVAGTRTVAADTVKYAEYTKAKYVNQARSIGNSGSTLVQQVRTIAKRDGFNDCASSV